MTLHNGPSPPVVVGVDGSATALLEKSEKARLVVAAARGCGGFPGVRLVAATLAVATSGRSPVVVVRGGQ